MPTGTFIRATLPLVLLRMRSMKTAKNASEKDIAIGERIRIRRMELGKSQGALASSLGISFQQVQKYESGVNRVGSGRLAEIAAALEVPITYFFHQPGTSGSSSLSDAMLELGITREGAELAQALNLLSADLRRTIVRLVNDLASMRLDRSGRAI